ncbi:hypothetical protein GCM10028801_36150 [Nocardioides maradonensis]
MPKQKTPTNPTEAAPGYPTAPEGTTFAAFFDAMEKAGMAYAGSTSEGGRFQCPYPGHEDERPSLDVTVGHNGLPIPNCKVCEQVYSGDADYGRLDWLHEVETALGINLRGGARVTDAEDVTWGERAALSGSHRMKGDGSERVNVERITYPYKFADGKPNFRAYRVQWDEADENGDLQPNKSFFVKRYVRGTGWMTGFTPDTERTPYLYERFAEWAESDDPVLWLVEGEKAVHALLKRGKQATTFQGGASAPLTEGWVTRYGFDRFEVRVWPDADEAGVNRARALIADLKAAGVDGAVWGVPVEMLSPKDDAYDVLQRKQARHIRPLTDADLVAYSGLAPAPKTRRQQAAGLDARSAAEPPKSIAVAGKTLVSASGAAWADSRAEADTPYLVNGLSEPYPFVDEYLDRHYKRNGTLTLRYADVGFWLWEGGDDGAEHYRPLTQVEMGARLVEDVLGATCVNADGEVVPIKPTRRFKAEVYGALVDKTLVSHHGAAGELIRPSGGVPFRNGWLDVTTGTLRPLDPSMDVRWVVPDDYDPDADDPVEWFKFLDSIGYTDGTDERLLLQEWFGYLLSGDTKQQKALMMVGPPRSGKGTILMVAEAMMGDGSVGLDLGAFGTNFGLQPVIGKGLATVGDARFEMRTDKATVRRLLSLIGQDSITIDRKHKDPVSVRCGARLMLGTNEVPALIEASEALSSRFLFLKMGESYLNREDLGLQTRVLAEIPGIVKWALEGLRRLTRNGKFTETESGREMQREMREIGNPTTAFVDEMCVLDPTKFVPTEDLYKEYALWATRHGHYVTSSAVFARDLNAAYPDSVIHCATRKSGRVRGFVGLSLGR